MSRRIIVSAGTTEPEIRQRGYVYQKGRKKSDPWVSTQRAYGFFRMDVPGQTKQAEVRIPLGLCRDRVSAMFKLREAMRTAGVLDMGKVRERITASTTFETQAAWWLAEVKAGHIVNTKTRKPMRANTIGFYSTAIAYLTGVVGNKPLASLDNPEARELVARIKAERIADGRRFSDKTILEFFRVFRNHRVRQGRTAPGSASEGVGFGVYRLAKGQQARATPAHVHGEGGFFHRGERETADLPNYVRSACRKWTSNRGGACA